VKSLMLLHKKLAHECARICCTDATLDCKTIECRVEKEGFSFMTITLPDFGKDLERALAIGQVESDAFSSFKKSAGLPRLFGGFLSRIFDRDSGVLLDEPCIDSIRSLRQLTLMFGKVAIPCSDARVRAAMRGYVENEQIVKYGDSTRDASDVEAFKRVSSLLFRDAFAYADREIYAGNVVPKHGPGSTADRRRGNAKYRSLVWTDRLEGYFPAVDYLLPNYRFIDSMDDIDYLEPGAEIPVKVISVPKTQKTPRIIAMEPTCMMYVQQGLLSVILEALTNPFLDADEEHPRGRRRGRDDFLPHFLGFRDQTPNQRMAKDGSLHNELATLDLSDASDRVSYQLVRALVSSTPHLSGAVDASRSRKADVPGHPCQRLAKFASMGSALCFPFEAMVFLTIIFVGIEKVLNTSLSRKLIREFVGRVRVYGDDLIVPVDYVQTVIDSLEGFGLKVNSRKSFWTGKFRESCGKEYYAGEDVSVVRVRELFPTSQQHATEVISIVSLRNQLYYAGYWDTVRWLDGYIKEVIRHFPTVLPTSPVLGRHSVLGYSAERIGKQLHNPLVRGWVEVSTPPADKLDGMGALLKFHLKQGDEPSFDPWHLERAGRPHAVKIKLRYGSAV